MHCIHSLRLWKRCAGCTSLRHPCSSGWKTGLPDLLQRTVLSTWILLWAHLKENLPLSTSPGSWWWLTLILFYLAWVTETIVRGKIYPGGNLNTMKFYLSDLNCHPSNLCHLWAYHDACALFFVAIHTIPLRPSDGMSCHCHLNKRTHIRKTPFWSNVLKT